MRGQIAWWSGSIANIPPRWHLCDGTGGTPDLRNKFIPAAGGTYAPGATGGAATHSHPFTADGHIHYPTYDAKSVGVDLWVGGTDSVPLAGTTTAAAVTPLYYALAFLMYEG